MFSLDLIRLGKITLHLDLFHLPVDLSIVCFDFSYHIHTYLQNFSSITKRFLRRSLESLCLIQFDGSNYLSEARLCSTIGPVFTLLSRIYSSPHQFTESNPSKIFLETCSHVPLTLLIWTVSTGLIYVHFSYHWINDINFLVQYFWIETFPCNPRTELVCHASGFINPSFWDLLSRFVYFY